MDYNYRIKRKHQRDDESLIASYFVLMKMKRNKNAFKSVERCSYLYV